MGLVYLCTYLTQQILLIMLILSTQHWAGGFPMCSAVNRQLIFHPLERFCQFPPVFLVWCSQSPWSNLWREKYGSEKVWYKSPILGSRVWGSWISSVQSLSHVWLFATPWTAAHQASLSFTNSRSLLKLMSITSVMPTNHLILCRPLRLLPSIFPSTGSFQMSQFFTSGGQSIGVSALASVLPMNIQDWFPLGLTGWVSLQSKELSRVFSNTTLQKHQFFGT